jgi:hypothetical protein
MIQTLKIPIKLTNMNELINANRSHWSKGKKLKEADTEAILYLCKSQRLIPFVKPIHIYCKWNYKRTSQDPDNIRTQIKPILDGLKNAGIIPNDSVKFILRFDGDEYIKSDLEGCVIVMSDE